LRTVLTVPLTSGPFVASTGASTFLETGSPEQETEDPCSPVLLVATDAVCDPGAPTTCGFCSACDPSVGCVPRPRLACRRSTVREGSSLIIQDKADDIQDTLTWKWTRGAATTIDDFFGSPLGSELALCVYEDVPANPELVLGAGIGCGATDCWKRNGSDASFVPLEASTDGIKSAKVHAGGDGRAQISINAGGVALQTPRLPLSAGVVVQLHSPDGVCWDATYGHPRSDTPTQFQAKSD
jgi:hypothetical protein